ncbi:NAD(P)-dependent oxidoreductase [bacterium]|nr:NAD(P)-dependent oxidoreductase [candidate division CSSED10-310 bacterium]
MTKPLCLVTGACGFMGSRMVEVLHEAGYGVRATDLERAYKRDDRKRQWYPSVLKELKIEFIPADITDPLSLASLVADVEYVFHIAGLFNYTAPYKALRRVNVDGTRNLLDAFAGREKVKRIVVWGGGGVYGAPSARGGVSFTEDMAPLPGNDYLRSKWEQEFLVMEHGRRRSIPYTIIRPTTVYGPRQTYAAGGLIMAAAKPMLSMVPANFTFRMPMVHVDDVCGAALFLASRPEAAGEVYNVNDDSQLRTVDFFKYTAKVMNHVPVVLPPVPLNLIKRLLGHAADLYMPLWRLITDAPAPLEKSTIEYLGEDFQYSNDKLKALGYTFKYADARDGLLATLDWYRAQGWL